MPPCHIWMPWGTDLYQKETAHHDTKDFANHMDLWTSGCRPKIAWPCFQRFRIYKNMCRSLGGEPNLEVAGYDMIRPKFMPLSVKKITEDRQCGFELFLFLGGNHHFHLKNTFIPDLQNGQDILVVQSKHVSIFQWFYISFAQPQHGAREAGDSKAWNK